MRVAFVVQRCGREVNGGAELHCLQVAQRMAKHWQTEVLTTCALDYMEWRNHYAEGIEKVGDTVIRRFRVDQPRDVPSFNALSAELTGRQANATLDEQEQWMRAQGPMSTPLLKYLQLSRDRYDFFVFFGYLYATTYFGLPVVREKAFLAPLAHDEWPIYFTMWDRFFSLPRGFFFNTREELTFLRRRFPAVKLEGPLAAVGIQPPKTLNPWNFRKKYCLEDAFLLYVGRIDESKGCREMIENFLRLRLTKLKHKLVLIGEEVMTVPYCEDIILLGPVPNDDKWNGMAACDWLWMPSPHESLSMVLLETWAAGRPAIVTAGSNVLVGHCRRSNGGLWYKSWQEFAAILQNIDKATKDRLGKQGQHYVEKNYSWERTESKYLDSLERIRATNGCRI